MPLTMDESMLVPDVRFYESESFSHRDGNVFSPRWKMIVIAVKMFCHRDEKSFWIKGVR